MMASQSQAASVSPAALVSFSVSVTDLQVLLVPRSLGLAGRQVSADPVAVSVAAVPAGNLDAHADVMVVVGFLRLRVVAAARQVVASRTAGPIAAAAVDRRVACHRVMMMVTVVRLVGADLEQ